MSELGVIFAILTVALACAPNPSMNSGRLASLCFFASLVFGIIGAFT